MPTRKQGTAKNTAAKQAAKKGTAQQTTQHGLMKPVQPSAELAAIVGSTPLPRTEITKRLWAYIKAHGLQDAQNKRQIKADATLRSLFDGHAHGSMLELPQC